MGMETEYSEKARRPKPSKFRPFLPVIGFILMGIFALIAYVLSGPAHELLIEQIGPNVANPQIQWVVMGGIFLILLMILAIIYSLFAPKPPKGMSEADLDREKRERAREREALKRKKAQARLKMRDHNLKR